MHADVHDLRLSDLIKENTYSLTCRTVLVAVYQLLLMMMQTMLLTERFREGGNAITSVRLSVRLFPLHLRNRLTVNLDLLRVSRP